MGNHLELRRGLKRVRWLKQGSRLGLVLFLITFFSAALSPDVSAQGAKLPEAAIYVDGQPIKTKYMLADGHLLVPALFLKETGARVDWNTQYRSVVFQWDKRLFALPVGKGHMDVYNPKTGQWKRASLPTKTREQEGEIFVPLVDVVKQLGMGVSYDPRWKRTSIRTGASSPPALIRKGETSEKLVALTFDDGPDAHYTPKILDILKKKGVPATFFIMGNQAKKHPEMLKRMVQEGHALGNHTMSHPDLRQVYSLDVAKEIRETQRVLFHFTGRQPDLFRPPYGELTRADRYLLEKLGLRVVYWSVDTLDWSGMSAQGILDIVERDVTPGAIILQHNILTTPGILDGTVEALPHIIDRLRAEGYQFVTVQTLLDRSQRR